jgi:hypothetical protein
MVGAVAEISGKSRWNGRVGGRKILRWMRSVQRFVARRSRSAISCLVRPPSDRDREHVADPSDIDRVIAHMRGRKVDIALPDELHRGGWVSATLGVDLCASRWMALTTITPS